MYSPPPQHLVLDSTSAKCGMDHFPQDVVALAASIIKQLI